MLTGQVFISVLMDRYIDTFFFPCLNALFLCLSIKFDLIYKDVKVSKTI